MADKPNVSDAIAAALSEDAGESAPPASTDEGKGTAGETPPEASTESTEETPPSGEVETETPEADQEAFKAFEEQWKVDLSRLPDDAARTQFIASHKETNKAFSKLQRENAELRKAKEPEAPAPPQPPTPAADELDVSTLSDQDLALALGMDLANSADPERDQRELALARNSLEMAQRLERLERSTADTSRATSWDKSLDQLETDFGKLPADVQRSDLLAYAAQEGIASPEAAYWAVVGPVRATIAGALESRLIELRTDQKRAATTPRPRTEAEVDEDKLQSTNVKDAMKEAFEKTRAALGITLES